MRKNLVPLLIALLVAVALIAGKSLLRADTGKTKDKPAPDVTVQGSVVDMHCYVTHGIHDAAHTGCANACIARGVPAGFLADDGTLYVLFGETPHSVKEAVKDMADVPAKVTGTPVKRGGVQGIQMKSIEKVDPKAPAASK